MAAPDSHLIMLNLNGAIANEAEKIIAKENPPGITGTPLVMANPRSDRGSSQGRRAMPRVDPKATKTLKRSLDKR